MDRRESRDFSLSTCWRECLSELDPARATDMTGNECAMTHTFASEKHGEHDLNMLKEA